MGLISDRSSLESSRIRTFIKNGSYKNSNGKVNHQRRMERKVKFSGMKVGAFALKQFESNYASQNYPDVTEIEIENTKEEEELDDDVKSLLLDYQWYSTVPSFFYAWKEVRSSRKNKKVLEKKQIRRLK